MAEFQFPEASPITLGDSVLVVQNGVVKKRQGDISLLSSASKIDVRTFPGGLGEALASPLTQNKVLVIPQPISCTSNLVRPANVQIEIPWPGRIDVDPGKSFDFNGGGLTTGWDHWIYPIFGGSGAILHLPHRNARYWMNADGSNEGVMFQAMIDSSAEGDVLYFPKGTYGTSVQINLPTSWCICMEGDGEGATTFKALSAMRALFFQDGPNSFRPTRESFSGFTINCNKLADIGMNLRTGYFNHYTAIDILNWLESGLTVGYPKDWSSANSYDINQAVSSGGRIFYSKQDNNLNKIPTVGGDVWWDDKEPITSTLISSNPFYLNDFRGVRLSAGMSSLGTGKHGIRIYSKSSDNKFTNMQIESNINHIASIYDEGVYHFFDTVYLVNYPALTGNKYGYWAAKRFSTDPHIGSTWHNSYCDGIGLADGSGACFRLDHGGYTFIGNKLYNGSLGNNGFELAAGISKLTVIGNFANNYGAYKFQGEGSFGSEVTWAGNTGDSIDSDLWSNTILPGGVRFGSIGVGRPVISTPAAESGLIGVDGLLTSDTDVNGVPNNFTQGIDANITAAFTTDVEVGAKIDITGNTGSAQEGAWITYNPQAPVVVPGETIHGVVDMSLFGNVHGLVYLMFKRANSSTISVTQLNVYTDSIVDGKYRFSASVPAETSYLGIALHTRANPGSNNMGYVTYKNLILWRADQSLVDFPGAVSIKNSIIPTVVNPNGVTLYTADYGGLSTLRILNENNVTIHLNQDVSTQATPTFAKLYLRSGATGTGEVDVQSTNVAGLFERTQAGTTGRTSGIGVKTSTTGNMADTFGVNITFSIKDDAGVSNAIGGIGAERAGADNTGKVALMPYNAGTPIDVLYATVAGINIPTTATPASTPADSFTLYSADGSGVGTAVPHFRTENGTIIKLNQDVSNGSAPTFSKIYLRPGAPGLGELDIESSATPALFQRNRTDTTGMQSVISLRAKTTVDMADTFGPQLGFSIQDDAGVMNNIANIGAERSGADNSGNIVMYVKAAGVDVAVLRLLSSGRVKLVQVPPTYTDNAAAIAGGLTAGEVYKTATGQLMVRY